jgi:APA family basic amino acid/polyamine antiporter
LEANSRTLPARGSAEAGGLARVLGPFDVTMLVMGSIVGAGIFNRPSSVAAQVGSLEGVLAVWTLGGLFAFTGAVVFAELGALMPQAGGQYVFVREAYGRFAAFLFGWVLLTGISSSALAFVAGVFADHLSQVLQAMGGTAALGPGQKRAWACGLILSMTALNARGVRLGATFQNAAMLAKIAGILLVCALGALVWGGWISMAHLPPLPPSQGAPSHPGGAGSFVAALLSVLLAYGGWQNVAAVAGEIRRPERALPWGILAGTAGVVILYVSFSAALALMLGIDRLASTSTPAADAAGAVFSGGAELVAGLVMLSTLAFVQGLLLLTPRIYYAMAKDGVFFARAAVLHPRWRTPVFAIALQGGLGCAHVLLAGGDLDRLVNVCILCDLVFFTSCGVALFVLRLRWPERPRPYRALGYPVLPATFVLLSLATIVQGGTQADLRATALGLALFGAGALMYLFWRKARREAASPAERG